jgi:8-amino-7-oxononanoate synthase
MSRFDDLFLGELERAEALGRRRRLRAVEPLDGGRVRLDGRELVDVSSNDYLGLSRHPALIERARDWAARYGTGSGASRLVRGTFEPHLALEARVAAMKGTEAALIFASGWQLNAAVIPALLRAARGAGPPEVFADELIHASMHQGLRAAGIKPHRFAHNDLDALERLLAERSGAPGRRFILTESVFSMDGDRADVVRLAGMAERHNAFLYLDEAHATGVLGPRGMGLAGLAPGRVDLVMGTFSKALGSMGGYVAASRAVCDYLVGAASGFVYTTAPPPAVLGAMDAALDLVPGLEAERARLQDLAEGLRTALAGAGIDTAGSSTQIVPALVGGEAETLGIARVIQDEGFLAVAIRPPTVPEGSSRIRFALSAAHADEDIERLGRTAARLWPRAAAA